MPTEIYCPFCNKLIVESTDVSELYDEDDNFIRDEFCDDTDEFDGDINEETADDIDEDPDTNENNENDFDEEEEKLERLYDYTDGECPHLAFWSDWAYAGSRIEGEWLAEMIALSCYLELCSESEDKITDQLIKDLKPEVDAQIVNYDNISSREKDQIAHVIADYLISDEDYVANLIPLVFPNHEVSFAVEFVCKDDGPKGEGGPTYMCVFMKEKEQADADE